MTPPKPVRIQRKRTKGWNLQRWSRGINGLDAVCVTRGTKWGNPLGCTPGTCSRRHSDGESCCIDGFDEYVQSGLEGRASSLGALSVAIDAFHGYPARTRLVNSLPSLRGKNLACFCALDVSCHADILLELANRPICEEVK
jgi:hypothetical protein